MFHIILIILFIIRSLISYGNALFSMSIQLRMNQEFQNELFSHMLHLPMCFFTQEPIGQLMSRVLDDAPLFSDIFNQLFGNAFIDPLKILFLTILLKLYCTTSLTAYFLFHYSPIGSTINLVRWICCSTRVGSITFPTIH